MTQLPVICGTSEEYCHGNFTQPIPMINKYYLDYGCYPDYASIIRYWDTVNALCSELLDIFMVTTVSVAPSHCTSVPSDCSFVMYILLSAVYIIIRNANIGFRNVTLTPAYMRNMFERSVSASSLRFRCEFDWIGFLKSPSIEELPVLYLDAQTYPISNIRNETGFFAPDLLTLGVHNS